MLLSRCAGRMGRCATARSCRHLATARRPLAGAAPLATSQLEPPVVDSFDPDLGVLRNFRGWCESTMAVVQLRKSLPGWAVPDFKVEAATLYEQVSLALAAKDTAQLQRLTTPKCYAALHESIESRPSGERHTWEAQEVLASVKQVRFAHSASQVDRRYVQVTCGIKCRRRVPPHQRHGPPLELRPSDRLTQPHTHAHRTATRPLQARLGDRGREGTQGAWPVRCTVASPREVGEAEG